MGMSKLMEKLKMSRKVSGGNGSLGGGEGEERAPGKSSKRATPRLLSPSNKNHSNSGASGTTQNTNPIVAALSPSSLASPTSRKARRHHHHHQQQQQQHHQQQDQQASTTDDGTGTPTVSSPPPNNNNDSTGANVKAAVSLKSSSASGTASNRRGPALQPPPNAASSSSCSKACVATEHPADQAPSSTHAENKAPPTNDSNDSAAAGAADSGGGGGGGGGNVVVLTTPGRGGERSGAKGKKSKRPPALAHVRLGVNLDGGAGGEVDEKDAVFRNDGMFQAAGFLIDKTGVVEHPATLERKKSSGSSLDGVARSVHEMMPIASLEELRVVKNIGQGASGRVYLAEHVGTGEQLAVKVVNVYDEPKRNQLMKELETLSTYVSRFLVRFYGAFYDGAGGVHIALEFMDCGALSDVIADFGAIPESVTNDIAFHCLHGLRFLHNSHVLHRDFKTANILLSRRSNRAKLSDFGLARDLESGVSKANTFVGTIAYMSPERLHGSNYTYASDIWGLGICIAECLLGRYPFEKPQSFFDYLDATMTENLLASGKFSKECEDFVKLCANVDPKKRPRVETLLAHPWIVNAPARRSSARARARDDDAAAHTAHDNTAPATALVGVEEEEEQDMEDVSSSGFTEWLDDIIAEKSNRP